MKSFLHRCLSRPGLVLFVLLWMGQAQAGTVQLDPVKDSYRIHPVVDVLEDADGRLTFEDVLKGAAAGAFEKSRAGSFSFGFTDSPYWFRFTIDNPMPEPRAMTLVMRTPWLDSVRLYLPDGKGGHEERYMGDRVPFAEREHAHPQFLVDLTVPPGSHVYYLRVATNQAFMMPIELWEPLAFQADDRLWTGYFGVFYGAVLVMFLYNGFIYLSIRDPRYLYYCLYLSAFFVMNFSYNGFSFQYLWPESPQWANWTYSTWIYLFQVTGILFAVSFLGTRSRMPHYHRLLMILLSAMTGTWVLSLALGQEQFYNAFSVFFVFLYAPLIAVAGIVAWASGYRAARFFVLASMATLVGAFFTALTVSGVVPYSFPSFHAAEFGLLLDVILLSLALADRINLMREEKETAQQYAFAQEQLAHSALEDAKEKLERTVAERTAELASAKEEAERLARVDALTGVSNRRYFEEEAAREFARAKRYAQPLSLIVFDLDEFKQINDGFGHVAGDAVIRTAALIAEDTVRKLDVVGRIGGEEFAILLPGVNLEQAAVTAERLRERMSETAVDHHGYTLHFTASFGVAQLDAADEIFQAPMQRADQAMYAAKRGGRNRVSLGQVPTP